MNQEDKRKVKIGILISAFTVLLYLGIQNLDVVSKTLSFFAGLLSPFILGVCIAFVLNLLMNLFEKRVFKRINAKKNPRWEKARRPVCIVITLILFLGMLTALIWFLIPQLGESVSTLANNMPTYLIQLQDFANSILGYLGVSTDLMETITSFLSAFSDSIVKYLTEAVPKIFQTTMSIASGIFNVFFGFVIAIYMLASKEKLMRNLKRVGYAFFPKKAADYMTHIYHVMIDRFSGFVSGQLTEAFILGMLCFIGMSIFRMPYALLISVIIGITNIVPIIGPILGTIPGALIILMINPMQAIWFVVFIIVLQQLESNLIYPRVVGTSVGLPGIWVMFGVLIGGNLFGLTGVILGVPTLSMLYVLLREAVKQRLQVRNLKL